MRTKQIPLDTYGTAAFVSKLSICRSVQFGGFTAMLVGDFPQEHSPILIQAMQWKGEQPRLVLEPRTSGYSDWRKMLDMAPAQQGEHRFVGSREAASNPYDQWLTSGPSALLR